MIEEQDPPALPETTAVDAVTIRLVEESARLDKRPIQTDRVRVSTRVEERRETLHAVLASETLSVERRPVEYRVDSPPPLREEGDVTILSVVEERAVVTKALFVVEEIHIRRGFTANTVAVPVDLRRTHAVVEQDAPGSSSTPSTTANPDSTTP